ncbi:tyf, partial [Drosophila busckii]
ATGGALSSQEQLLKAISIGHDAGINNATNDDEDANIATLNSNKIQAVVPDTPIVSIAGGTLSESTSTTTSTKTTPTPYPQEQLTTLMSHNVKQEQHPTNNNDDRKQSPDSVSNHNTSCNNNANVDASPNQAAATEAAFANTATSTGTARSRIASTHPNLKLSPLLSKSGQPAPEVIAAATALHQRRGATTKGKTQDDQNVGKRQKKKKTKYDAWEDSDFNDLDDASLKKLLEEAYWYRNPGDRKNKSERFLESDVSKKLKLLSNANNPSMSFKTEKLFNQQMQLPESNKDSGGAAVQEFLIDDPLTFSMLEISAKNQQLQQQLQQQLMQQQQMQPQYFPAGPMNAAASGIGGQFTITMDEQRRRIDPGYVSLNDSYTACSSVYGAPSCSNANSSEAASKASSCGNSADSDLRPAKMGRMMSAAAAAAVAASHGAKATSRQFDENGNALSDASLASSSSSSGANQFQTLISNSMAAGSNSGQLQRSNGISTQLASGSTTAMAAAAVAASLNSQLQQGPMMAGALMAAHGQTKLKLKKKSQQERNTTTVDVMSVAGYRGNDPIEQLVKYIENEEKNGMQQQKKKERKQKQSKLKKCNSLEELRSCAKMEVDELKHQSATTDQMMRNSKKNGNGNSSSSNGKHNSASVADISKNCNKEQQQQQQQQQQPAAQPATGRKSERRSWGTEELQYLGEPLSAVVKPAATAAWAECAAAELSAHPIVPMPLPLSELEALNTVLCETAEFHVVTKKKKPKKQRAVTMDDAAVAAAAHTGGNLQRMQQITKSASSNMMSQRLRGSIDYYNNGNHYAVKQPPQQQQYQQQQQHQQQQQQQHQQQSTAAQDNSRRKSTSSMPPSEKSDSSDLDSVHSLPIQTGKKKSNNKRTVAPVKHNSNTNSHNKTNSNSSPPAPISYADIARNKLEALANAGDDLDTGHNEVLPLPEAKPKLKAKQRPDFPELPGATVVIATAAAAAAATSSSSSSISYSQSLNATPPSSGSSDAETTPETTPSVTVTPTTATATAPTTTSTSSNTNIVTTANVATSTNSAPPPALQKSRSVEHDASGYSFNSSNLDLQYPALEKTVKRHSASNVSLPASNSALSFNFAAAARQLTDKSSLDATSSSTSSSKLSLSSASTSSGSSSSSIKSKSASKELSPSASSKKDKPVIKPSQELEEQAPPPPAPAKVTAATQTDSAKKYCSSNSGASSSANSSSSSGSMSLGSGPRPAVIILNDDRDSALGRLNNEFIFGDFNEDELKLFDDAGEKDKAKDKKQAEDKPSSVSKPSSSSDSASANSSVSASTSEQQLNDSGAASDVVNSSACLDMLMISGQAAQSSPNTANNSSTSSSASNSTSVSTSSSSSTLSNISCTETIKQLVNQSSDSGIYAQQQQQHQPSSRSNSVQNLHIKDQVNHFLRKANSTQSSCSSMDEPLPQLETCNDIEAAIIAAARAAAAAARSSSCSRSNSQEQKQEEPKVAQPKAKPKSQQASPAKLKSTRPAILMTYSNADAAEDEAELSELSFVAELKSEPPVCEPNRIPTPPPMPPNAMRQALMDNSELIVEYISSSWNAIVNSKYVTFYCEQEEQTI